MCRVQVDVGDKGATKRSATAENCVTLPPTVFSLLRQNQLKKGDALTVAQIAATAENCVTLPPTVFSLLRQNQLKKGDALTVAQIAATAENCVTLPPTVFSLLRQNQLKKGDALTVAQIAGVMGAKLTPQLIPLCHTIALDDVQISFQLDQKDSKVLILCTVRCEGRTGCEMEALTGASLAALCLYDMCKSASHDITIGPLALRHKSGGKSDLRAQRAYDQ